MPFDFACAAIAAISKVPAGIALSSPGSPVMIVTAASLLNVAAKGFTMLI